MVDQAKALLKSTLGPQALEVAKWIHGSLVVPILDEPRLHWLLFLLAVLVALVFFVFRSTANERTGRGFVAYLLPRSIFLHPSAVLDYKFYVVNQVLMGYLRLGSWVGALVAFFAVADVAKSALTLAFGPAPSAGPPSIWILVAFTFCTLLASDFGKYVAHYLLHKVTLLWEFHKTHHAAQVLTPFSSFRVHPIEPMLDLFMRLMAGGVVGGVFAYFYPDDLTEVTILSFNAIAFFIFYPITHLQHSHIALGYGPHLSKWLVSPLMHQVHHSLERRHWDKNMGFVFSIWDRLFGTLYVPAFDETFRLGLPVGSGRFDTVADLFVDPFVRAYRRVVRATSSARPIN